MAKLIIFAYVLIAFSLLANAKPMQVDEKENTPAERARYLMSKTEWISIATISTIDQIKSYPFVNVKSTADGATGTPYLLLMDYDLSVIDLHADNRMSALATFAGGVCKEEGLDPQNPRCPRLILTGSFEKVENETERKFGRDALVEKHPIMEVWENVHTFYVAKMVIDNIEYLGNFGGAEHIAVADYFAADPAKVHSH